MKPTQQLKKYLKNSRIRKLYEKVKAEYAKPGPIAHGWDHISRVIINAIWIGEAEGADMDIVIPAVILHDIGFLSDPHPKDHHIRGAKECYEWLEDWNDVEKEKISGCIKTHKGNKIEAEFKPKTLEEKVVCDADLLEKKGAIGVFQGIRSMVEFAEGELPQFKSLYNITKQLISYTKKSRLRFYTSKGKELASKRGAGDIRIKVLKKALKELKEYEK